LRKHILGIEEMDSILASIKVIYSGFGANKQSGFCPPLPNRIHKSPFFSPNSDIYVTIIQLYCSFSNIFKVSYFYIQGVSFALCKTAADLVYIHYLN